MSNPVLCTLAKHHVGDHDERGALARSACRKVIRYEPAHLAPADVAAKTMDAVDRDFAHHVDDGDPFDPITHAGAEAREAENDTSLGGLAGCDGHDHGSLTKCVPPCPAFDAMSAPPEPAPEPSTADLIVAVLSVEGRRDGLLLAVREARDALDREERRLGDVQPDLEGACSALAKHIGKGALVSIGGALFRSVPPRKPKGGELAADALWRLEPVEVAK